MIATSGAHASLNDIEQEDIEYEKRSSPIILLWLWPCVLVDSHVYAPSSRWTRHGSRRNICEKTFRILLRVDFTRSVRNNWLEQSGRVYLESLGMMSLNPTRSQTRTLLASSRNTRPLLPTLPSFWKKWCFTLRAITKDFIASLNTCQSMESKWR